MSTNTAPRRTTEQRRAAHAFNAVCDVLAKHHQVEHGEKVPDKVAKAFGRMVKDLPTRILTAGLGQALAFQWAKRDDDKMADELLRRLGDWVLNQQRNPRYAGPLPEPEALLREIISDKTDAMFLRRATEESLAYLHWLKRFAEAYGLTKGED